MISGSWFQTARKAPTVWNQVPDDWDKIQESQSGGSLPALYRWSWKDGVDWWFMIGKGRERGNQMLFRGSEKKPGLFFQEGNVDRSKIPEIWGWGARYGLRGITGHISQVTNYLSGNAKIPNSFYPCRSMEFRKKIIMGASLLHFFRINDFQWDHFIWLPVRFNFDNFTGFSISD